MKLIKLTCKLKCNGKQTNCNLDDAGVSIALIYCEFNKNLINKINYFIF